MKRRFILYEHELLLRIHASHFFRQHTRVLFVFMKRIANWSSNISRSETRGGNLIEHRLEEMIVVAVD